MLILIDKIETKQKQKETKEERCGSRFETLTIEIMGFVNIVRQTLIVLINPN